MAGIVSLDHPTDMSESCPPTVQLNAVRKRDGRSAPFDRERIVRAIEMAFRAELGRAPVRGR
jgi:hypothetical protein